MAAVTQLQPEEAQRLLQQAGPQGVLLDVRESWEYERVHLPGSVHIPMGDIPARLEELNSGHTYVVMCHHGMRSLQVAGYLSGQGFQQVANLAGGIDAWAEALDPTLLRY